MNQLNQLIDLTRSELKRDDRQRIMSLITVDAHARDVVLMLIRENVTDKVRCVFLFRCVVAPFLLSYKICFLPVLEHGVPNMTVTD